ncbi:LysR family transcriptional regulator [Sphingomonas turrisvirgatae]|uniref:LysR family transcriptional regulator n=1 Tax=Sphingomonas turrisvirgatae TaxID=1888892 RepID=UPI000AC1AC87|nr:LysR family transcriptional regulator [Sphingomonas turrisvirgatae]
MDPDYALFASVVEAGNLSAAGRMLGMSPGQVSKRLARLEARLGVRLAHRTTRALTLTEQGAAFHAEIADVLARLRAAEARLMGSRDVPAGRLKGTAPTSFGRLHVAPHLDAFLRAWPEVQLEIELSDGFADIIAARIDVAIRITATPDPRLAAQRLATSARILCAAPDYLSAWGEPRSVNELARHRLLAADGQLPWLLSAGGRRVTVAGTSHVRTNSSELVRELAVSGVGIALRSLWDVAELIRDGRLVRVLPQLAGSDDVAIYAMHAPAPALTAAAARFVEHMQVALARPAWG